MKCQIVYNSKTGEERFYSDMIISKALIIAYLQAEQNNYNTWDYEKAYLKLYPKLIWTKDSISIGNWSIDR